MLNPPAPPSPKKPKEPPIIAAPNEVSVIFFLTLTMHSLGVISAVTALFHTRSSQGAIAWIISLVLFPYIAVPLYWILGRTRFRGYVESRRGAHDKVLATVETGDLKRVDLDQAPGKRREVMRLLQRLTWTPFSHGNTISVYRTGKETFEAMFEAMDAAEHYLLVQFFIIHDDRIGTRFKDKLIASAKRGITVYLLYDAIGCFKLPGKYLEELREAGVNVASFHTTKGRGNRMQINFRNHRKMVVADGRVGFVGGHNVGDEYMGEDPRFGPWRDTTCRYEGPCVAGVQLSFAEDWHWAKGELPGLQWNMDEADPDGRDILVLPTGPGDEYETCAFFFLEAIQSARKRLWIVSPYFVPDLEIQAALTLAALRGVDVRIMLPEKPDHKLVWLASFSYLSELCRAGVKFYRYTEGFLHQKVILVDDLFASVGTANADNRSFRLNFEISMVVTDDGYISEIEGMLLDDFTHCRQVGADEYEKRWFGFRASVKAARLLAPIL